MTSYRCDPGCTCPSCVTSWTALQDVVHLAAGWRGRPLGLHHQALAGALVFGARRWCSSEADYVRASCLLAKAERCCSTQLGTGGIVSYWRRLMQARALTVTYSERDEQRAAQLRAAVSHPRPWELNP